MTGKTHQAVGLASIIPLTFINVGAFVLLPYAAFGALLPDIDADYSLIQTWKYIKRFILLGIITLFISKGSLKYIGMAGLFITIILLKKSEHRTITHSLIGLGIFSIYMLLISPIAALGFTIGYVTHLFTDSLTISGIQLLYPNARTIGLRKIQTGSSLEEHIHFGCWLFVLWRITLYISNV